MDSHRFDALAQRLAQASSRRQALAVMVAGALASLVHSNDAAAKCKGYKGKCKKNGKCCGQLGLRCKRERCRCKQGWQHCPETGNDCTNVTADSNNCGACGAVCPPATPCCINGSCRELCGGSCCADCFIDYLGQIPQPNTATCCGPGAGTFCLANKQDPSDDKCCYPDQACVNGECCSDGGLYGSVICGGTCCSSAACCNGACCPGDQVCAMTAEGMACVSADRNCASNAQCFGDESCVGGTCCKGDRICSNLLDGDFCCAAGTYCDFLGPNGKCCDINTRCNSTWRSHRVRK